MLLISGEDASGVPYSDERIKELRDIYDWPALKQIIKRCPQSENGGIHIQDVYNLIDMHLQSGRGFSVEGRLIRPERMAAARNTVNMITVMIHAHGYRRMLQDKRTAYGQYYEFAKILAEMMKEEGLFKEGKVPLNKRDFYLFS
ncbi:hypothetical protein BTO30_01525 [Domibacillus antri]|uniref:Uncharacterized protein n=1 Tax=Domibacillus antri TaxID=1714264 RepID=A0A1Q8Q9V7_9BACI|nr:hypothetical protein [Domibacillus antri]OLN24120.1 hypothetical protein BTO30_01525 [Domibacillus antri]